MSVIIPITRRQFVMRPSVALVPLPPPLLRDPAFVAAAGALGVDVDQAEWGGITLVAGMGGEDGRSMSVSARIDDVPPSHIRDLTLFAMDGSGMAVSMRFQVGEGGTPLHLRLPLRASQPVAAVLRQDTRRPRAVAADLRHIV